MRSGDVLQHQSDRDFYPPDGLHLGCHFRCGGSNGLGELWRRAKVLLRRLASQQILFLLYTLCTIALLPLAKPGVITQLSDCKLACLIFCGLNTLVGYGALAEAMARWQAAQVSALITLTPLFTLLFSDLLSMAWPDVFVRPMLNLLGYLGAFVVVAGAMYSAIGHRLWGRWRKNEAVEKNSRCRKAARERIPRNIDLVTGVSERSQRACSVNYEGYVVPGSGE